MTDSKPSTFVTVVAWIAILGCGLFAVMGMLQAAILVFAMPDVPIDATMRAELDPVARFMFSNFRALVIGQAALWAIGLACAVGLLKRREWGRRGIVILLLLAVALVAGTGVWQQAMLAELLARTGGGGPGAGMMTGMRIASGVMSAGMAAGMAWLAARLNSPRVKAECS